MEEHSEHNDGQKERRGPRSPLRVSEADRQRFDRIIAKVSVFRSKGEVVSAALRLYESLFAASLQGARIFLVKGKREEIPVDLDQIVGDHQKGAQSSTVELSLSQEDRQILGSLARTQSDLKPSQIIRKAVTVYEFFTTHCLDGWVAEYRSIAKLQIVVPGLGNLVSISSRRCAAGKPVVDLETNIAISTRRY